jgi:hypothetical protein
VSAKRFIAIPISFAVEASEFVNRRRRARETCLADAQVPVQSDRSHESCSEFPRGDSTPRSRGAVATYFDRCSPSRTPGERRAHRARLAIRLLVIAVAPTVIVFGPSLRVATASTPRVPKTIVKPSVGIVGDSITWLAQIQIAKVLDPGYDVAVAARPGMTTHQQLGALQFLVGPSSHRTNDILVELGTNDAIQQATDTTWARDFSDVLALTSRTRCVILVTVNLNAVYYGKSDRAVLINALIAAATRSHRNIHELNWAKLVRIDGNEKRFLNSTDGIHPNVAGVAWLTGLYRRALQRDCPVPDAS